MKLSDFSRLDLTRTGCTQRMDTLASASSRARARRAAGLTCLLAALALVAVACGGSSKSSSSAAAATTGASGTSGASGLRGEMQAFTACLQQHGVTIPTRPAGASGGFAGGGGPSGASGASGRRGGGGGFGLGGVGGFFTNPADQAAVQACQSDLPAGMLQQLQQRRNALAAFESCMSDHGVTITGNTFNPRATTTTTPAYAAAFTICKAVLPTGGFGRFGGGSTTTTTAA